MVDEGSHLSKEERRHRQKRLEQARREARLRACESFIFKKTFSPRRGYHTADSLRIG